MAHSDGHELSAHLFSVAEIGQNFFSENFENASKWVYLAGLWHDLGKYRVGFQKYLALSADENAHIEGRVSGTEKTHSIAGALWANRVFKEKYGTTGNLASRILAYLIASHHAGLYDWYGGLNERLAEKDSATELAEALAAQPPEKILSAGDFDPVADMKKIPGGAPGFALWVRMMFSCLVDADFLDTEAHFDAKKAQSRKGFATIETLLPVFDDFMASKVSGAAISHVNVLRAEILKQCRDKANLEPGFFSLTVPTGGGKTLSSLAFALSHADLYCKRRIIYAIPYTSIIEQTADQFRQAFLALEAAVSQPQPAGHLRSAASVRGSGDWPAPRRLGRGLGPSPADAVSARLPARGTGAGGRAAGRRLVSGRGRAAGAVLGHTWPRAVRPGGRVPFVPFRRPHGARDRIPVCPRPWRR